MLGDLYLSKSVPLVYMAVTGIYRLLWVVLYKNHWIESGEMENAENYPLKIVLKVFIICLPWCDERQYKGNREKTILFKRR